MGLKRSLTFTWDTSLGTLPSWTAPPLCEEGLDLAVPPGRGPTAQLWGLIPIPAAPGSGSGGKAALPAPRKPLVKGKALGMRR